MLDIATLEGRLADAWPALVDEPLGAWRLRAACGFTGRANSALTCGDPGLPLGEALSRVVAFARQHGIAPTAHVVRGDPLEDRLTEHGWRVDVDHPGGAEPLVLVAPPDGASPPDAVTIATRPSTSWWRLCADTTPPDAAQRHVLGTGECVGFGEYVVNGALVGAVRGAVVADTLHVARLAVSPAHRRGGVGSALMAGIGAWGKANGATHCALQVAADNPAALALYGALGFTEHHRYRYWVPGGTWEDRTS